MQHIRKCSEGYSCALVWIEVRKVHVVSTHCENCLDIYLLVHLTLFPVISQKKKKKSLTLYLPKTSLVKPYLEKTNKNSHCCLIRISQRVTIIRLEVLKCALGEKAPQVYDVILVVPPVQMHVVGIDQQEAKQDQQDL